MDKFDYVWPERCMAFFLSLLMMLFVCIWSWDGLVNGKLYYCTDGGSMDFIYGTFGGYWVHNPEAVAKVVPRPMDKPDEIKTGWSNTDLWRLWSAFVGASVFVSAFLAGAPEILAAIKKRHRDIEFETPSS